MTKVLLPAILLVVTITSSCSLFNSTTIHTLSLKWFGKIYSNHIHRVSLKQLHLEQQKFEGEMIFARGYVHTIGEYGTYFVLQEGSRKLLVMQYPITDITMKISDHDHQKEVSVIGELTSEKKGLPALLASVVAVHHNKKNSDKLVTNTENHEQAESLSNRAKKYFAKPVKWLSHITNLWQTKPLGNGNDEK
ncbi:MAG: hypothetical protein OXC40_07115 [Proteobacteria bacterium]|nr:hypothetical protein [Pseudomonadota bacterium]